MQDRAMVIVGTTKPLLNYVTACITLFNQGSEQVTLRARGQAISTAVDVLQLLRRRFMKDVLEADITIDSDTVTSSDGRSLALPVIEIRMSRKAADPGHAPLLQDLRTKKPA